jgi:hypothetical protein
MFQSLNQRDTKGVKVDYQDGFQDGVKFAREVVIANIRKWAEDHDDGAVVDWVADRIEFGTLDNDL